MTFGPGLLSGMEEFLTGALKSGVEVDLRTMSGFDFKNVTIGAIKNGAMEVRDRGNTTRLYVIKLDRIEWAVAS